MRVFSVLHHTIERLWTSSARFIPQGKANMFVVHGIMATGLSCEGVLEGVGLGLALPLSLSPSLSISLDHSSVPSFYADLTKRLHATIMEHT